MPLFIDANVCTRPDRSETNTPPSVATHTCRLGATAPVSRIEWTSPWTLLPISPALSAPSPPGGTPVRAMPLAAVNENGGIGGTTGGGVGMTS